MTTEQIWQTVLLIYGLLNAFYLFHEVFIEGKRLCFIAPEEICIADILSLVFLVPSYVLYGVIYTVSYALAWAWENSRISSLLRWKPFAPKKAELSRPNPEPVRKNYVDQTTLDVVPKIPKDPKMILVKGTNKIFTVETVAMGGVYVFSETGLLQWYSYREIENVLSFYIKLLVNQSGLGIAGMKKGDVVRVLYIDGHNYEVAAPIGKPFLVYTRECEIHEVVTGEF